MSDNCPHTHVADQFTGPKTRRGYGDVVWVCEDCGKVLARLENGDHI